jgi:Lon protease-like protein
MLQTVYLSDHLKIEADDALAYIRAEWLGDVDDEQFVAEAMRAHAVLIARKPEKALVNAQQAPNISSKTKDWLANIYYDLYSQTPVKKMARVLPENIFRRLALTSVLTRVNATTELTYEIRDFSSEEEAVRWLLEE